MKRTTRTTRTAALFVAVVCGAIAVAIGAPQPQPQPQQPLAAVFSAEAKSYAPAYGHGVQVGTAVGKTVHYADAPPVVGYAAPYVYKPDLSAYAAASFPQVEQLRAFNPVVRPVHTVVPKVTAVEPSVTVQKTYVDVPVHEYAPAAAVVFQHPASYYNYQLVDRK